MKGFFGIFKESDGAWSMRRVLAFIGFVAGIACGIIAVLFGKTWQDIAIAFGMPISAALILLFFTTWTDVIGIINAVRKG